MRKAYLTVGALAVAGLLAIAGCGGGSSTSGTTSGSAGEAEAPANSGGAQGGGYYGSESKESSAASESEGTEPAAGGATTVAVVKVMSTPKLGKVIVNGEGMTLYDFHKDKGTTSSCYGACATAWPPLLSKGEPRATGGAQASLLGTTKRKDGTVQVTYNGHPLYGFVADHAPGETNGNGVSGFGALWFALQPNGEEPAGG